jgi:hypothetical protein
MKLNEYIVYFYEVMDINKIFLDAWNTESIG